MRTADPSNGVWGHGPAWNLDLAPASMSAWGPAGPDRGRMSCPDARSVRLLPDRGVSPYSLSGWTRQDVEDGADGRIPVGLDGGWSRLAPSRAFGVTRHGLTMGSEVSPC